MLLIEANEYNIFFEFVTNKTKQKQSEEEEEEKSNENDEGNHSDGGLIELREMVDM